MISLVIFSDGCASTQDQEPDQEQEQEESIGVMVCRAGADGV
jgi:hypothetical protein